jgi:pantetheine-phosphate adenylyltransferase
MIEKGLKIFDKIVIAQGVNPDKSMASVNIPSKETYGTFGNRVQVMKFKGLLASIIEPDHTAILRGLRNGQDFEFEKTQQYWNEDLGITIPTVYVVCDRKLVHISSSAIRAVEKVKKI